MGAPKGNFPNPIMDLGNPDPWKPIVLKQVSDLFEHQQKSWDTSQ